jgi:hypothetical protein
MSGVQEVQVNGIDRNSTIPAAGFHDENCAEETIDRFNARVQSSGRAAPSIAT